MRSKGPYIILLGIVSVLLAAAATRAEESLEQRREKLELMSDVEKTTLLQKKRRFEELPVAEQDRLRQLHEELAADSQQQALQGVLERYHNWLRTLTPAERAEVLSLPADKRVEKINELIRAQESRRFRMMVSGFMISPRDLATIHDWFDKFLDDHAPAILASLPDEPFGKLKKEYDPERDRGVLRRLYFGPGGRNLPLPSKEDEVQLLTKVSKEARDMLAKVSEEERSQVIQRWTWAAELSRMRTNPSPEELLKFAQESLSEGDRRRLENSPRDRMYRELRFLYGQQRFGGEPNRGPPWVRRGGDGQRRPDGGPRFDGPPPGGPPPDGSGFQFPGDFPGKLPRERENHVGPPSGNGPGMAGPGMPAPQPPTGRPDTK
ncbi:MAG: hypothetical protein ACYC3X_17575 [Pirellulaceae bacterium]